MNKIPTSVGSGNDTNTDLMTAGERSAKEKSGDLLVDLTSKEQNQE